MYLCIFVTYFILYSFLTVHLAKNALCCLHIYKMLFNEQTNIYLRLLQVAARPDLTFFVVLV